VLVAIPVSLALARGTTFFTEVSTNGSAYRQVAITVQDEEAEEAAARFLQRPQFRDWQRRRQSVAEGTRLTAEERVGVADAEPDVTLGRTSAWVVDFWSTYHFSEQISPIRQPRTRRDRQLASLATFRYELRMPGAIVEVEPAAEVDGSTARWRLKAGDAPLTIRATSRAFKYGNAVVVAYLALWAGGWIGVTAYRRVRARPKRI
jgi:hypothetical protein